MRWVVLVYIKVIKKEEVSRLLSMVTDTEQRFLLGALAEQSLDFS